MSVEDKPEQDGASAEDEHRQKEVKYRDVHIESAIKIDIPESLRQQIQTSQAESAAYQKRQLFWTIIGAALVFAYTTINFFSWLTTRDSEQRQLRAYVSLIDTGFALPAAEVQSGEQISTLKPFVDWKNTGFTPTVGATDRIHVDLSNTPLQPGYVPEFAKTDIIRPMLIGPHSPIRYFADTNISRQDWLDVQAGTKFLYLFGWFRYEDVFHHWWNKKHITRFFVRIRIAKGIKLSKGMVAEWFLQPTGNCTDDDCTQQDRPK